MLVAALALALGAGWLVYPHDCLVADAEVEVEVLAEPSPPGYPSTNPTPNRVVGKITASQRAAIWYSGYEKDYLYYKVRLPDGTWGYVVSGCKAHVRQSCR